MFENFAKKCPPAANDATFCILIIFFFWCKLMSIHEHSWFGFVVVFVFFFVYVFVYVYVYVFLYVYVYLCVYVYV